eukprot:3413713-Alexandrium_andersonii.AAC.1
MALTQSTVTRISYAGLQTRGSRIAARIASSRGAPPLDLAEKRLWRVRQHFSPPPSDPARK